MVAKGALSNWTAVYERQDHGWVAYCAEYPGSGVTGPTLADARRQLRDVMDGLLRREAEQAAALEMKLMSGAAA